MEMGQDGQDPAFSRHARRPGLVPQDLLTQHRDRHAEVENDAGLTADQKKAEDGRLEVLIYKTAKAYSAYGNRQNIVNKDVTGIMPKRDHPS